MNISAEAEQIRKADRTRAQLQAQRLRQWDEELTARDVLLRQYLTWVGKAGVRPLTRRRARRLGIEALYRRRDPLWLVAGGVGPTGRGGHAITIAGVYASGETIVRGLKAYQLAECIARQVAAAGRPWPDHDWDSSSTAPVQSVGRPAVASSVDSTSHAPIPAPSAN